MFLDIGYDKWVLGEPLLKNYLVSVDLSQEVIEFHVVSQKVHYEPSAFETYEGWVVVAAAVFGSLTIYLSAAGIYQLIKRKMDTEEEAPLLEVQPAKSKPRQI